MIITSPGHALARARVLGLADLVSEPFVGFPPGTGLRRILDDDADAAGFTPTVPFETTDLTRVRGLVGNGLGIALVARSIAEAPGPPVTAHPLAPPIRRGIALIHRRGQPLTPAAQACHRLLLHWRAQTGSN